MDILRVENLKKHFPVRRGIFQRTVGWVRAVENVSLALAPGKTIGLVGESGCGKTTVARMILNLLPADGGRILYKGNDICGLSDRDMKPFRKEIQIVFQDPYGSLNPRMTVGQTLSEGLRMTGARGRTGRQEQIERLLGLVGMAPTAVDRYPHEFSGGQRQRIGIARALSVEPALVVCDEPVSALDVSIQAQIINLLKDLQDRLGLSYVFISHDLNVVGYLCHHVAVMYKGQIMEYAPAEHVFENPLHPYTRVLLAARPDPESGKGPPAAGLEGERPEPALTPTEGCRFQIKCPEKHDRCRLLGPELALVGDDHWVRCWQAPPPASGSYYSGK
ncbi:MAG: ATP-binding cassette domain-containing protein [Desulfobacterales bacterium]|jgi:oligopeptide/dipeptide ABC transporter ATP-binding protein|nr:ATP-binding cassette domain-containing protein [Desulfobacterales bacterium]